jgi:NADP-reducing hydrogenase subunit HndC
MNEDNEVVRLNTAAELERYRQKLLENRDANRSRISICAGTGCLALGVRDVITSFKEEIKKQHLESIVDVKENGCPGFCEQGPIVVIYPQEICYLKVGVKDVPEIISQTIQENRLVEHLLYKDEKTGERVVHESDIPFYKNQNRILLGNNRLIDPQNIDDYLVLGGYAALTKVLFELGPDKTLEAIKKAKLRGRGGGGFATWQKWETTRRASGDPKYVIVNADEGDPGAFMNRSLLEGNPHSVLEGLIIGAYVVGAHEGYIYVRQEYPLAVQNVNIAIEQARKYGLLGTNILGSGFDFDVKVHRGAGAFVSGESSALMSAIEGKVGEPRPKYIHTAVSGVNEKPSVLNNVETWANVPLIINKGADWFNKIGGKDNTGTKIFALVGKINNSGLVEVPLGTPLRKIVFDIGGGIPGNQKLKAVQIGGPSGGCLPEHLLDMPVDFDAIAKLGLMMGSGGIIVMDENTCMVDIARYFVNFLSQESCGKCIPCREGLRQMLRILNDICAGKGKKGDLETLEEIAETMRDASLCALGATAANPVLSTLKYFKDEYKAHIEDKSCPAGVCKDLIAYYIDPQKCQACLICARKCPVNAIEGEKGVVHVIDQEKCNKCGTCFEVCPSRFKAVVRLSRGPAPSAVSGESRIIAGKR